MSRAVGPMTNPFSSSQVDPRSPWPRNWPSAQPGRAKAADPMWVIHLVRMITDGDDPASSASWKTSPPTPAANPSRKSRQQLFTWLTDRDMTIIGWTPPSRTPGSSPSG